MAQQCSEPSLVREQVARIVHSPTFIHSERLSHFLAFAVEQALEGSPGELKETTIALEVFGRKPSYDPKLDPIVRVEARWLRRKLETYYGQQGARDPIRILLPKGSYVPVFRANAVKGWGGRRRIGTGTAAIAAAALLLLAAFSASLRLRNGPRASGLRAIPFTSLAGLERFPAFSPDGARLAFVADADKPGNHDIYLKSLDGVAPFRLTTDPAEDLFPEWSPDGSYIAFVRRAPDNRAWVMVAPSAGGPETKLTEIVVFTYLSTLSWSPDG